MNLLRLIKGIFHDAVAPAARAGEIVPELAEPLVHWCQLWELPALPGRIQIQFSARLNYALGRCRPRQCRITLSDLLLLEPNRRLLVDTLGHEAAHIAAFEKFGPRIKPHGPEWRSLMRTIGLEPHVTARHEQIFGLQQRLAMASRRKAWEYQCPHCQVTHLRRSRNTRLRCRACLQAGRSGVLRITRRELGVEL